MEFEQILTLIDHVSDSKLASFEYEAEDLKLSMECGRQQMVTASGVDVPAPAGMPGMVMPAASETMPGAVTTPASGAIPGAAVFSAGTLTDPAESVVSGMETGQEEKKGNLVKSPLVGTFYAAPSEEAEPYAKVGDTVKKGQVLAIVEAMKLMNEIESDFDGEVVEIYVKNGESVEYGQPLFRIV